MNSRGLRTAALWLAFAVVHAWLWTTSFTGPNTPLNDVTTVYHNWVQEGTHGLGWVGVDQTWVYPSAALAPMLLAAVFGLAHYSVTWLGLVVILDGIALAYLTRGGRERQPLGWWWLAFMVLLGPIAVGRLDSISVPLALVGLLYAVRRPVVAGILLALATWIKVWPAALVVAVVIASKRRIPVLVAALGTSVVIVAVVLLFGGSLRVIFGFVGQQAGRGLQIEAPVTTWWLWLEGLHVPGVRTAFDYGLLTYQTTGPGTALVSQLMTPIMAVVLLGVILLGVRAMRRGAHSTAVLAPLALALVTAFIVTNKVGSPQYETWIAAPMILGLLLARRGGASFVVPASMALVVGGLTQVIYPWNYDALVFAQPWMLVVVTARNLLLVGLLVVGVVQLVRLGSVRQDATRPSPVSSSESVPTVAG
ncbi:hypothetical protein AX769_15115 [Frondihabitans sp. PAMC 28766]|uniref:glycosyltransferase 87 family protein n=1 Tax=Frondihabitans sp. PAMC 28766 TaxID=1795630 RepID=UPI00078B1C52|nr:glycosyltransferase 87 family protein [Frondihabitans sp. PAMC 28766]AMM21222.1 hypothetical protein AX769_15115 [Frondihabitans sp. PAMC 28766]